MVKRKKIKKGTRTLKKKSKKKDSDLPKIIFVPLLIIVLLLATVTLAKAKGYFIPEQPEIKINNGIIELDSLTLEQKIAQMVVGLWVPDLMPIWKNLQLGGIYMYSLETENYFKQVINEIQEGMIIPFFITADAEGCFTPFESFWDFTPNSEIISVRDAYEKGFKEGELIKNLGITLNFAPVVDLEDEIWKCRSFPGTEKEVAELAHSYVLGLQSQGVLANAKHYPGKTLVGRDPHKFLAEAEIESADLYPYDYLIEKGDVASIMVSHIITTGEVDSEKVPSVVSEAVVKDLKRRFPGLIISDEIHMLGLKSFYDSIDQMYIAVFKAGNDIILNFDKDPNEVHRMIKIIATAVENEVISEEQIDDSVTKILKAKGFKVD